MAIDAVSSMMTVQAQGSAQTKAVTQSQGQTSTDTVESAKTNTQEAEKIDQTTSVVENAQTKNQTGQAGTDEQKEQQATNEQIRKAVEAMNKNMGNSEAIFGIHEGTNRVTIKIVDKSTKEVIKELPPEKTLDMIAKIWDMAGLLVDEKR